MKMYAPFVLQPGRLPMQKQGLIIHATSRWQGIITMETHTQLSKMGLSCFHDSILSLKSALVFFCFLLSIDFHFSKWRMALLIWWMNGRQRNLILWLSPIPYFPNTESSLSALNHFLQAENQPVICKSEILSIIVFSVLF